MVMAIRVHRTGGPEVLQPEELAAPNAGPGQVLVRNTAVAVNMLDIYQRSGRPHPNQPSFPYIPGSIQVGTVESRGAGVAGLQPGRRVVGMDRFGAYSQQTVVAAERVVPVPGGLDDAEVAAIFVRGLTAFYLTHLHHRVEPGQVLLVHAAAGGLGQLLCRWASHLGATVIGTVGAPAKQEVARSAGCAHVLLRTEEDVAARCMDLTGGQGVDIVYDSVGRDTVRQSLACLRPGGHAIVCGAASGTVENFSLEWLHARSCKISRPTVETYVRSREQLHTAARAVFDGMHNLTGEYLKSLQKLDIVHVPYRGTALAVPDLLSGRLSLSITGVSSGGRLVLDKQVQAVGVTSTKRSPALLLAPAGTPPTVVARLGAALREALKDPVLIQQEVTRGGNELLAGTAEELSAMLSRDHARWGRGIKEQGIKGE